MSQTFTITWVGDQTRDWEANGREFTAYKIALAGYDPSAHDPEAGKTVEWSRHKDAPIPAPGDEVYGGVQVKQYEWGNKYVFKTEQRPSGLDTSSVRAKAPNNSGPTQDSDWWYAKDRRISRAGILQAVVASGMLQVPEGAGIAGIVDAANTLTDALVASLDERTPHPSAPKAAPQQAVGVSNDRAETKPVIEDVTPRAQSPLADEDQVPF